MSGFVLKDRHTGLYVLSMDDVLTVWNPGASHAKRFDLRSQAEGFIDVYGLTDCKVVALKGRKRGFVETKWAEGKDGSR